MKVFEMKVFGKKDFKKITDFLTKPGLDIKIKVNADCAGMTSYRAGGKCKALIEAGSETVLSALVKYLADSNAGYFILGEGTNVLFNDGYIDLFVIKLTGDFDKIALAGNGCISAGAAASLQKLVIFAAKHSLDLSFLAGIPGTVGGAVAGNSGTTVKGICSMVKEARYLYVSNGFYGYRNYPLKTADYGYRFCILPDMAIITGILIAPETAEREDILKTIRKNIKNKKRSQPIGSRSPGCFFKNPSGSSISAGEMIDDCGLRGFHFGDCVISEKHANFIINSGNASASDVFVLSKIAAGIVKNKFNIELESEVKLVGF